jgi:hypothetical protein
VPYPWSATDVLTAADLNAAIADSLSPPRCYAYQGTTATTLTTGAAAALPLDSELFDTPGTMHSLVTNTSRIVLPTSGYYRVIARVGFASNATGFRRVVIALNGTNIAETRVPAVSGAATVAECVAEWPAAAGQYFEMQAQQNSGGNLDTATGYPFTGLYVTRAGL